MRVAITGYVLDSAVADPRKSQSIAMAAGETGQIDITVKHADGTTFDLTGGQLLLTVEKSGAPAISRQATFDVAASGTAHFPLVIFDTLTLMGGHTFDIWWTAADGSRYQVVPPSTINISAAEGQPNQTVTVPASQIPLAQGPAGAGLVGGNFVVAAAHGTASFGANIVNGEGVNLTTVRRFQTTEVNGPEWREWFASFTNPAGDGHLDQVYGFGWNLYNGAPVNVTRGALGWVVENDYQPTSNKRQIEHYLVAYNPVDGVTYRPFSVTVDVLNAGPPIVGVAGNSFGLQRVAGGPVLWGWTLGDNSGTCTVVAPNVAIIHDVNNACFWMGRAADGSHVKLLNFNAANEVEVGADGVTPLRVNNNLLVGTDCLPANYGGHHSSLGSNSNPWSQAHIKQRGVGAVFVAGIGGDYIIDPANGDVQFLYSTGSVTSLKIDNAHALQGQTLKLIFQQASPGATWPTTIGNINGNGPARLAGGTFTKTLTNSSIDSLTLAQDSYYWDEVGRALNLS